MENRARVWIKAVSWNVIATLVNFVVIWALIMIWPEGAGITQSDAITFGIIVSVVERVFKIAVYVWHEKFWE